PVGLLMMGIAIGLSFIKADDFRMVAACLGIVLSMSALIMLVPYITDVFVAAFQKLYALFFGNIGLIAAKNLRDNRNVLSSISMLVIGISSLLMINTAGYDSVVYINDMYTNAKYDIEVYYWKADRSFTQLVRNVDGVSDVYGEYSFYNTEVENNKERVRELIGVDSMKFLDFFNLEMDGDKASALKHLDEERSLLISETLQKTLKVEVGDYIRLKTSTGEKSYRIAGTFGKLVSTGRNVALASSRFIRADMQAKQYNEVYVKADKDPEIVAESLRKEFKRNYPYITTKEQSRKENLESNKQSTMLMSGFSVLASVIGIFGILNNLMLGFIERKHSFAVFRSMGMSKKQLIGMIFVESATGGLIGGLIGIMGGVILITMLAGAGNLADIHYPIGAFVAYGLIGAFIMLVASVSPAIKTSRLNIIDEIKFE
ncbi:MAG: ABC transporter permease, partial [Pseudomonadota bacterium]